MANAKYLDMVGLIRLVEKIKANFTTYKVVTELPSTEINTSAIYLHKKTTDAKSYTASVHGDGAWVNVGDVDLSGYAKLNGNNTFTGENTFNKLTEINAMLNIVPGNPIMLTPNTDGHGNGGIISSDGVNISPNKVWACDGTVKNLEAYDNMLWKTFPLTVSVQNNGQDGTNYYPSATLEKGVTKDITIKWGYSNDKYFPVSGQTLGGGTLSSPVTVSVDTTTYPIKDVTDASTDKMVTYEFKITAQTNGHEVSGQTSVTFVHKSYAGAIDATKVSLTAAEIKALSQTKLATSKNQRYTLTQDNQKLAFCYPKYLTEISSIKDANGFEGYPGYSKSIVSVDGVKYWVYLSNSAATNTGTYSLS